MHLTNPWYELIRFKKNKQKNVKTSTCINYLFEFLRWQKNAYWGPIEKIEGDETLTAIILNHARVRNIEPIIRSLFKLSFITKIIVSNNDAQIKIHDWIRIKDDRLTLLDAPPDTGPFRRDILAAEEKADYFLFIDDDVFLYPSQIKKLFLGLLNEPSCPRGIQGQIYLDEFLRRDNLSAKCNNGWVRSKRGVNNKVDVLNKLYLLTKDHLNEIHRLAKTPEINTFHDDLLISFSGKSKPYVQNVGKYLNCLSHLHEDIAICKTTGSFNSEREKIFIKLREIKPLVN